MHLFRNLHLYSATWNLEWLYFKIAKNNNHNSNNNFKPISAQLKIMLHVKSERSVRRVIEYFSETLRNCDSWLQCIYYVGLIRNVWYKYHFTSSLNYHLKPLYQYLFGFWFAFQIIAFIFHFTHFSSSPSAKQDDIYRSYGIKAIFIAMSFIGILNI